MLICHRTIADTFLDATFAEHQVLHSQYRLLLKVRRNVVTDDALIRAGYPSVPGDRNVVFLPLQGEALVRSAGDSRTLHEGELGTELRNRGVGLRQEGTQLMFVLEWEPGTLGSRKLEPGGSLRLPRQVLNQMKVLAARLMSERSDSLSARDCVHEMLLRLRAEGLPLDPWEAKDLVEEVPHQLRSLAHVMDAALSAIHEAPTVDDLSLRLGWSRRHVLRNLETFNRRYASLFTGGWREMMRYWRIPAGAMLMSTPKATTEYASRRLGYAGPRAFRTALANTGFPAPGDIRTALRELH